MTPVAKRQDYAALAGAPESKLKGQSTSMAASIQLQHQIRAGLLRLAHICPVLAGVFEEPSLGLLPPSTVLVMEGDFNKNDIVVQVTKPSTIYRALHNASPKLRGILSETGKASA